MAKQQDAFADNDQPGVGVVKDKVLDRLADEFSEKKEQKAELATEMTAIEGKIIDRMIEKNIKVYRYSDREVRIKDGKSHIKVKTVKMDGETAPE